MRLFFLSEQTHISELYVSNLILLLHVSNWLLHQQLHSRSLAGTHAGKSSSACCLVPLLAGGLCSLLLPSSCCAVNYIHNPGFNLMFTIYSIAVWRTNYSERVWNRREQSLPQTRKKINGMKHCLSSMSPGSERVVHCRTQRLTPVSYFHVFAWYGKKKRISSPKPCMCEKILYYVPSF